MQANEQLLSIPPLLNGDVVEEEIEQSEQVPNAEGQNFTMVPKSFSESLQLEKVGPRSTRSYKSTSRVNESERTYCCGVELVPSLVPYNFLTVLVVDGDVTYYERIDFDRRTKMKNFSETVNSFGQEMVTRYRSDFVHDFDHTQRRYVQKLELMPVQKMSLPKCSSVVEVVSNEISLETV